MGNRGFQKVTLNQYKNDVKDFSSQIDVDKEYNEIKIPRRATALSAGYDFYSPRNYKIEQGQELRIPTGIRVYMKDDEWLGIYIRSSLGFKYGVRLKNSVAVIDADYINAKNEGHIWIALYNSGKHTVEINEGESFAQGIFQKYLLIDNDEPVSINRIGGIGSTTAQ